MNSCTFTGRLGRDPELRSTRDGQPVCNFSLAVDRRGKNRDDGALWLDVSAWGKTGENVAKFLRKGSEVAVAGNIDTRTYPKSDGTTGFAVTLNAREVSFIGPKADDAPRSTPAASTPPASAPSTPPADDDIPFLAEPVPSFLDAKGHASRW